MAKLLGYAIVIAVLIYLISEYYKIIIPAVFVLVIIVYLIRRKKTADEGPDSAFQIPEENFSASKSLPVVSKKDEQDQEIAKRRKEKKAAYESILDSISLSDIIVSDTPAKKRSVREADELSFSTITKKSNPNKMGNFVVIDTETTGLYASKAEIVEIAAIRFRDWEPVEKFITLCSPRKGISEEAARINGITSEMVEGKPEFGQIAESLQNFIGTDNIVGHNLGFDLEFIVKHGVDVVAQDRKYFDTLYIAEHTYKKAKQKWDNELRCYFPADDDFGIENYKLPTLCAWCGIPYYNGHRALADCYSTGLLFRALVEERTGQKIGDENT